jgi:hypothetical protein
MTRRTEDVKLLLLLDPFSVNKGLFDEQIRTFQLQAWESRRSACWQSDQRKAPYRRNRILVLLLRGDSSVGGHGQGAAGLRDSDWTTTSNRTVPKKTSLRSGTSQVERQKERIGGGFRDVSTAEPDSPLSAEMRGKALGHATEVLRGQLSRHAAVLGSRREPRSEAGRATANAVAFQRDRSRWPVVRAPLSGGEPCRFRPHAENIKRAGVHILQGVTWTTLYNLGPPL